MLRISRCYRFLPDDGIVFGTKESASTRILALSSSFVLLPVASISVEQESNSGQSRKTESEQSRPANEPGNEKNNKEKLGEIVIAPIRISSPAIGCGLLFGLGYVFPLNKND